MKTINFHFLISFLLIQISFGQNSFLDQNSSAHSKLKLDSTKIERQIKQAYSNPYQFFRKGNHFKFIDLLLMNPNFKSSTLPLKELLDEKNKAQQLKNQVDEFILNILLHLHSEHKNSSANCTYLYEAGSNSFEKLENPQVTLQLYQLASNSKCPNANEKIESVSYYLENDWEIAKLLKTNWTPLSDEDKRSHLIKLKSGFMNYPGTNLKSKLAQEIGNMNFWLREFSEMQKWYNIAISHDKKLKSWEVIQTRMDVADLNLNKKRFINFSYFIYALALGFLILTVIRSKQKWNKFYFFKRAGIFSLIFIILGALIIWWDSYSSIESSLKLTTHTVYPKLPIFKPIVPLSVGDPSYSEVKYWIILLGLFPILYITLLTSINSKISLWIKIVLILIITFFSWTHYFLKIGFDADMYPAISLTKTRFYINGELDSLLIIDKEAGQRIRPWIENSGNPELHQFYLHILPKETPPIDTNFQ